MISDGVDLLFNSNVIFKWCDGVVVWALAPSSPTSVNVPVTHIPDHRFEALLVSEIKMQKCLHSLSVCANWIRDDEYYSPIISNVMQPSSSSVNLNSVMKVCWCCSTRGFDCYGGHNNHVTAWRHKFEWSPKQKLQPSKRSLLGKNEILVNSRLRKRGCSALSIAKLSLALQQKHLSHRITSWNQRGKISLWATCIACPHTRQLMPPLSVLLVKSKLITLIWR